VIETKYGALHGLLHSALQFNYFAPLFALKTKEWNDTLTVNLHAPFLLTRVLLPVLQQADHASIVFTSDSSARLGKAYSGAYGVSKIALEGLAKILADELETAGKIRVNTLVPGAVNSPFRKQAYPGEDKTLLPAMTSLNPVYRYLFSDESLGITGQIIDAQTFNPS
jgi:NAD(P)-dependent dehydrogenase (short-subunit alcohol dehydrogenase family)